MTDNAPPIHPLLEKICAENEGFGAGLAANILGPFGIDIAMPPAGRWDAATNGAVILAFAGGRCERDDTMSRLAQEIIADAPATTHYCTMAALREWAGTDDGLCRTCDATGFTNREPCEECRGDGEVQCDLGHDHECPGCDGEGTIGKRCEGCDGRLGRAKLPGWINGAAVNRCLLAGLVGDLPGDLVAIGASTDALKAVFLYGHGWVLTVACLYPTIPEDAPRLDIRRVPT